MAKKLDKDTIIEGIAKLSTKEQKDVKSFIEKTLEEKAAVAKEELELIEKG